MEKEKNSKTKIPKWLLLIILVAIGLSLILTFTLVKGDNNHITREVLITCESMAFSYTLSLTFTVNFDINSKIFSLFGKVVLVEGDKNKDSFEIKLEEVLSIIEEIKIQIEDIKKEIFEDCDSVIISKKNEISDKNKKIRVLISPFKSISNKTDFMNKCLSEINIFYDLCNKFLNDMPETPQQLYIKKNNLHDFQNRIQESSNKVLEYTFHYTQKENKF